MTKVRTLVAWSGPRKLRLSRRASPPPTMRTVTLASRSSAARAQRRTCAGEGALRVRTAYCTLNTSLRARAALFAPGRLGLAPRRPRLVALVGIDDALHQGMAHDVLRIEVGKRDTPHALQHFLRFDQATLLAAREIDLGYVAVHNRLAAEADACQEHLHLLGRGVLRFVQDHERVIEGAPAHEGERRDLDGAALEELGHAVVAHQV